MVCGRRDSQEHVQKSQSSSKKVSIRGGADLNYTTLEITDGSPSSPENHEMNTFKPVS